MPVKFPIEYEFVPEWSVRIVTDDNRIIGGAWIGPMFADWLDTLTESNARQISRRDWLTRKETASFWQYLGRPDKRPNRIQIQIKPNEDYATNLRR